MSVTESNFQFENYVIKKFSLTQNPIRIKTKSKFLYSFEKFDAVIKEINETGDFFTSIVQLSLVIHGKKSPTDKRPTRKVEIAVVGEFKAKNISKEKFEKFCLINGTLQLLSIARSYIASTTAATGAPSIIMPLINLPATLKD